MIGLRTALYGIVIVALTLMSGCATIPPELDSPATAHLPRRVELSSTPFYPQQAYQCGPAALATVLQVAKVDATPEELTPEVFLPGRKGSLALELVAATRARDRLAYPLDPSPRALLEELAAGRPVLVMQNVALKIAPTWHFAVVIGYDLDERTVTLRSGTVERLVMSLRGFMRTWDLADRWAMVVLEPDELPSNPVLDKYLKAAAELEATGRLQAAARAYTRAHEHWPASPWPALGIANVAYAQGDRATAERGYRTALALDPGHVVANHNLAEVLLARGCVTEARAYAQRALDGAIGTPLEQTVRATADKIARTTQPDTCLERSP
jgi:tetratricopeptide (TPR) repeat protein